MPLPSGAKARLRGEDDYHRARAVDWSEMAKVKTIFTDLYLAEIRQGAEVRSIKVYDGEPA